MRSETLLFTSVRKTRPGLIIVNMLACERMRETRPCCNSRDCFPLSELQTVLAACASVKTPNVDNIPYEAFCVDLPWFLELCRVFPCVPALWKHGIVAPLAKCTNNSTRDDHRPITLTCCVAKIIEKILLNQIHALIDPSLDECQEGFRWGSDLQAYSLMETLRVTGSSTTFSSFLDIRKAFDVAWRDGALLRLFRAGVQGADCHLIDDLISDRTV